MKKFVIRVVLCTVLILAAAVSCTAAETLGFGYVNANDVAVRRGMSGKVIGRLPMDTCVWIKNAGTDSNGVLWYEINAGVNQNYTNIDYSGWMKAEFIDAGDALWYNVTSVRAAGNGIIVLRKDGTAQSAGGLVISKDGSRRVSLRHWLDGISGIASVGVCDLSLENYAIDSSGVCYSTAAADDRDRYRIRVAGGRYWPFFITADDQLLTGNYGFSWVWPRQVTPEQLSHVVMIDDSFSRVLFLMDDGSLLVGCHMDDESVMPEPDWESWTGLISVEAAAANFTEPHARYYSVYAGVREDGTVLAVPEIMNDLIGSWQGMRKIVVAGSWILGLKQDGTALTAGTGAPDVSGWTGITDIDAGYDYCVGLKENGSLVFAGEHVFCGEGHNKR